MEITVNDTVLYICIFESCAAAWIGLEMIILSEVNQTEKDRYHMMSFICGIYRMIQVNFFCRTNRITGKENK